MSRRVRVLIADDSAVMRTLLRQTLTASRQIEVLEFARDGVSALAAIERLRPDLVLLDIEMPGKNGIEVLKELRRRGLGPKVIMCSTLTRRGAAITLDALALGASDYVAKPEGHGGARGGIDRLAAELVPKILALCAPAGHGSAGFSRRTEVVRPAWPVSVARIVVVGVSTGGPQALERLLGALPESFPLPVAVVQHMPSMFTALLAERLDGHCALRVREAAEGAMLEPGSVWIARGDWHLEIEVGGKLRLKQTVAEQSCRPSVDLLFRSAAAAYGPGAMGVVLTGMGTDGLEGCRVIREAGGAVVVQDEATSAVWGMPGAVAQAGLANVVLPLDGIAGAMVRFAARRCSPNASEARAIWR